MLLTWLSTLASLEYPNTKRSFAHAVSQDEAGDSEGYGQEDAEKGEDGFFRPSGCGRRAVWYSIYQESCKRMEMDHKERNCYYWYP